MFYCVDKTTGKRTSLQSTDKEEAEQIIEAKNQAVRQPALNLQIAYAYLVGVRSFAGLSAPTNALARNPSTAGVAGRVFDHG